MTESFSTNNPVKSEKGISIRRSGQETAEAIKQSVDLVAYIRGKGVELKKRGTDFVGLCPFHKESKPSLVVSPAKRLWHCLGCDKGGSVIDFEMEVEKISLSEALKRLCALLPASTPDSLPTAHSPSSSKTDHCSLKTDYSPAASGAGLTEARIQQLLERVLAVYEKAFAENTRGYEYLHLQRCLPVELTSRFRIGLADGRLADLLPKEGPVLDELDQLGIIHREDGWERFHNCVVFPVYAADGTIATLYGRKADHAPGLREPFEHRKNSDWEGGRHYFLPNRPRGLWNLACARDCTEVIVVESVIDALSVMAAGFGNVLSIQSANGLDDREIEDLQRLGVQRFTLLLDGDDAGRRGAEKLLERLSYPDRLETPFPALVATLPDGFDPNKLLCEQGPEALANVIAAAKPHTFDPHNVPVMRKRMPRCPELPATPQPSSAGALHEAASSTTEHRVPNTEHSSPPSPTDHCSLKTDHSSPGASHSSKTSTTEHRSPLTEHSAATGGGLTVVIGPRRYSIHGLEKGPRKLKATLRLDFAGHLHVDTLDLYVSRARQQFARDLSRVFELDPDIAESDINRLLTVCETADAGATDTSDEPTAPVMSDAERDDALQLARDPDLPNRILADFETCGLVGEETNKLLGYLVMTSRKMNDPLSLLILSSSGAGKTALQDATLAFCPPEDLVKLTSLSGKALFYKERHSLKHKVLALEEGAGAEDAAYAIRNLISSRALTTESAMRDPNSGRLTTMENTVEGPTAVFVTTTDPKVDAETRSRFLVTGIDESREQTRRILAFQRTRQGEAGLEANLAADALLRRHRNFQRLLRPLRVVNTRIDSLLYSDDRLQSRRVQPQYLGLLAAVAFLRQYQKEVKRRGDVEYIEVDDADIDLGNRLAAEILGRTLDELSIPARNLLSQLTAMLDARLANTQDSDRRAPLRRGELTFTRREVRDYTGWGNTRLHVHLKELLELEYVVLDSGRGTSLQHYRLLYSDPPGQEKAVGQ
jgi:DNA primase